MTNDYLDINVIAAAKAHALREYPKESCGLVVDDTYRPCFNYAVNPEKDFVISEADYLWAENDGGVQAVLHSHPDGPLFPTEADMQGQLSSAVPWGIIPTDGERAGDPIMWGDQLPIAPLIGREFRHGVADCYTLVRDAYRLGKDGMKEHGIDGWPLDPIQLPEVPRDDNWWETEKDLYVDYLAKVGFRQIDRSEARPGDGMLFKIRANKLNHAAVLLDGNVILHHLPNRPSRREAAGIWVYQVEMWLRYEG